MDRFEVANVTYYMYDEKDDIVELQQRVSVGHRQKFSNFLS